MKVTAEKSKTKQEPRVFTFLFLAAKPAPDGLAALLAAKPAPDGLAALLAAKPAPDGLAALPLSSFLSNLSHKDA